MSASTDAGIDGSVRHHQSASLPTCASTSSVFALQNLTWPEAERLSSEDGLGLVTLGALEQHGPHLPLATDSLLAERVASGLAERLHGPVLMAPVFHAGISAHHIAFPGTVTVPPDTYRELTAAFVAGLERIGLRKIALWSWHGGNFDFIREFVAGYNGPAHLAGYADMDRYLLLMLNAARSAGLAVPETDSHAGGIETSMMLAFYPHLVRPFDDVVGYTAAEPGWEDRLTPDGWRPLTENGVLGDARGSNAEVGEAVFEAAVAELAAFFTRELEL